MHVSWCVVGDNPRRAGVAGQGLLDPAEIALLMAARHRPSYCLRILTEVIKSADLMEGQAIRMDENLSFFEEQVGTCERCAHCWMWPNDASITRY